MYDKSTNYKFESWQLIHILKRKQAFIKLDDGSLGVLPKDWLNKLFQIMKTFKNDSQFTQADLFAMSHYEEKFDLDIEGDESYNQQIQKLQNGLYNEGPIALESGPEFNGELFGYQKQGLGWLKFLDEFYLGGLLADEMGLGKTVQVIAFLDLLKSEGKLETTLIVAPKSLVSQCKESVKKF